MKNVPRCFVVLFASVLVPWVSAEMVAFLGVEASVLAPGVAEELSLPAGVGLLVQHLPPGGPAETVLELDDVLHKLDDQLLIHPSQIQVLVRSRSPGDEMVLAFFRGGEAMSATVRLGETPAGFQELVSPPRATQAHDPNDPFGGFARGQRIVGRAEMLEAMQQAEVQERIGGGVRIVQMGGGNRRTVTTVRDGVRTTYTNADGKAEVRVTRGDDLVFEGPLDTPEQRAKVPGAIRADLIQRELIPEDPAD